MRITKPTKKPSSLSQYINQIFSLSNQNYVSNDEKKLYLIITHLYTQLLIHGEKIVSKNDQTILKKIDLPDNQDQLDAYVYQLATLEYLYTISPSIKEFIHKEVANVAIKTCQTY